MGEAPAPGKRDVRPLMFTEDDARVIEARLGHVEFVPDHGRAS